MSAQGIGGIGIASPIDLGVFSSRTPATPSSITVAGTGGTDLSSLQISSQGQLLKKLQELKDKDPQKFQQLMSDIAAKLRAASQDPAQAAHAAQLAALADKFDSVAKGGDVSQLVPSVGSQQAHGAHRRRRHHQQAALLNPLTTLDQQSARSTNTQIVLAGIFDELQKATANLR